MTRILIVEDEPSVREMTSFMMKQAGYECLEAENATEARAMINSGEPALILMDWMLPGTSGIELTRELKESPATRAIPVIMLTARGEEDDKVRGLESGADDYVTKPFSPRELTARVKALLRRTLPHMTEEVITSGDLSLDPSSHRIHYQDAMINLGPTEFRLLHFFMAHPEKVYSRGKLLDNVWGTNVYVEERTVDVHVRRLRKALEPYGADEMIQTVRGAGYRFSGSRSAS